MEIVIGLIFLAVMVALSIGISLIRDARISGYDEFYKDKAIKKFGSIEKIEDIITNENILYNDRRVVIGENYVFQPDNHYRILKYADIKWLFIDKNYKLGYFAIIMYDLDGDFYYIKYTRKDKDISINEPFNILCSLCDKAYKGFDYKIAHQLEQELGKKLILPNL